MQKLTFDEFMQHFPKEITEDMIKYAEEEVFKDRRYIFTKREGKKQYGYCSYCNKEFNKEFEVKGLKHNALATCPLCKSKCTVKASGYKRGTMVDTAYFVYYEKSRINPDAIVAIGIYAVKDYRHDYRKVTTKFAIKALYLFQPGYCEAYRRYIYYSYQYRKIETCEWEKCKSIYSEQNKDSMANIPCFYSRNSIRKAVAGTPFAWSGWHQYDYEDMVKFFSLYARYPVVEYLTKLGFSGLVIEKLNGNRTYSAINWHGKSLFKVLKLTKNDLNEIRTNKLNISFSDLKLLQLSRKDGSNFSVKEAYEISKTYKYYLDDIERAQNYCQLRKLMNYLDKQYNKDDKHYYHKSYVLTTWRDYINDCIKLKLDLKKEAVLFPKNLYQAHQNTIKQIKIKEDEALNQKIKVRLEKLNKKYYFEYQGLMIRPAQSTLELIEEGKALNHCVGTYAKQYAEGKTDILFIRSMEDPSKSFYTVEICNNTVLQVRGKNNCPPDENINVFMEAFKSEKLGKEKKTKIRVPA